MWFRKYICGDRLEELRNIQGRIIGDHELATPEKPVKQSDGSYLGGTAFERDDQAEGVKGSRCFYLGPSHQHSTSIVSPNAGGKVCGEQMNANQQLRHDILKVWMAFA
jgi:hypothetical protein